MINKAVLDLYGDWSIISEYSKELLEKILKFENLEELYNELNASESYNRDILLDVINTQSLKVNEDNVNDVINEALKLKKTD